MSAPSFDHLSQYKVLREVAVGGMGTVYLVEQLGEAGFSKTVAIKTIRSELIENQDFLEMFIGEAKLVADLIHENIVQVYQFERRDDLYFIVMEFVYGKNLSQLCQRVWEQGEKLEPDFAAFIMSRIARALSYAHNKRDRHGVPLGIVHRDVSPGNAIISFQGVVKLGDFGIAKAVTTRSLDETEVLMGKVGYLSPEQARFEVTDARSDIFSLGLVMYEALTGKKARGARETQRLIEQHEIAAVVPVRELNPDIPEDLAKILMQTLAPDPTDRSQTAWDVVYALEYYMYHDRYGPTNEKLSNYITGLFPEEDPNSIV